VFFTQDIYNEGTMGGSICPHVSSLKLLSDFDEVSYWGRGDLHWKLLNKFYFGLYWSNITPSH